MLVKEIIEGYNESVSFTNQIGTFTISPERVKYTLLRKKETCFNGLHRNNTRRD